MKTKQQKPKKHGVYVFHDGKFYTPKEWGNKPANGVLLYTEHASIIIDLKDLGYMSWDKAQEKAKGAGKILPDDHESLEIVNHINKINKVLKQIGGKETSGWYWTRSEYSAASAWGYSSYGAMSGSNKLTSDGVRAVTAF
jgi:hypothetical protein